MTIGASASAGESRVFCYPVAERSKYVRLLFSGLANRYAPVFRDDGGPPEAIAAAREGERVILHIQWEELLFRRCAQDSEASALADDFTAELDAIRAAAIPVVWTVHNGLPHGGRFIDAFLRIRRAIAARCDLALVHGQTGIALLAEQLDAFPHRVELLPHPSYLGYYEPEETTFARAGAPPLPVVLGFGAIRAQKRFDWLVEALPAPLLATRGLKLHVSGRGPDAAPLRAAAVGRSDVDLDLREIADEEVPALLGRAACVVLPYSRVLSSGVAMSVLSAGGIPVATRDPAFIEMLPGAFHRFLFDSTDPGDLWRAIDAVLRLTPAERTDLAHTGLDAARAVRPAIISQRLGYLYDKILARSR